MKKKKKIRYEYEVIGASAQPALASNFVEEISIDSLNNRMLVSTQAGGFSILDTNSTFTTSFDPALSSNNIVSGAGQTKMFVSASGTDGKSYLDFFDGSAWNKDFQTSASLTSVYKKILFNGSSFFILERQKSRQLFII